MRYGEEAEGGSLRFLLRKRMNAPPILFRINLNHSLHWVSWGQFTVLTGVLLQSKLVLELHCMAYVCAEFDTKRLFSHSSLKAYIFENLILRGRPSNMFWDITNSLEANPGPTFHVHRELTLMDMLCPSVKLVKWFLHISYIQEFLMRDEVKNFNVVTHTF